MVCGILFFFFFRSEERKTALLSLIKKAREARPEIWNEYFNAVLLILLETLGDVDVRYKLIYLFRFVSVC